MLSYLVDILIAKKSNQTKKQKKQSHLLIASCFKSRTGQRNKGRGELRRRWAWQGRGRRAPVCFHLKAGVLFSEQQGGLYGALFQHSNSTIQHYKSRLKWIRGQILIQIQIMLMLIIIIIFIWTLIMFKIIIDVISSTTQMVSNGWQKVYVHSKPY